MATKKINCFKKLINLINGFEAKRAKEGITLDLPTQNMYDGIIHWAEYGSDAYDDNSIDLCKIIYSKILEFYENVDIVSFFLTSGKFHEHKEAEWIESECKQIAASLNSIISELNGDSAEPDELDDDMN